MRILLTILIFFFTSSCSFKDDNVIRVGTLNSPTTYYIDKDSHEAGFEYDLLQSFFEQSGYDFKVLTFNSINSLINSLERQRIDLVAAGMTKTSARDKNLLSSKEFMQIDQNLLCRPHLRISHTDRLHELDLIVMKDSSYEYHLREQLPEVKYKSLKNVSSYELAELIHKEKYDCTILDSNIIRIVHRSFPRLEKTLTLKSSDQIVWYLSKKYPELHEEINEWFAKKETKEHISELKNKHFGHTHFFDPYDIETFKSRIKERLPDYISLFKIAAREYDLDWKVLAALSYQESNWNPLARSPTGVRGLMMLTQNTAKSLGVTNRIDPEQSINGGAKYLSHLLERIPEEVQGEDRLWMALAAYNIGFAHLRNARTLAGQKGLNPNSWLSLEQTLPLLGQKKYYSQFRHGFARGGEPVFHVRRIRHYLNLLRENL